jgi:TatD DNase family protein
MLGAEKQEENRGIPSYGRYEGLLFDSHAHLDDEAFEEDREALLSSLAEQGVGYVVNVTASLESLETVPKLIQAYPFLYGTVGIHPSETEPMTEALIEKMEALCRQEKMVAVGEIGLDYHWEEPEKAIQKKWFLRQLALAEKTGLPVSIHSREAAQDTLECMKEFDGRLSGGVIHCFSYGIEMAREYLNRGYYLGIGGVLTFRNARKLKEVAEFAPLEALVLETDSPYLSPEPFRGKRNDPTKLRQTAEALAALKGVETEEVIRTTTANAMQLYKIKERQRPWQI